VNKIDVDHEELVSVLKGSFFEFIQVFYPLLTGRDFLVSNPIGRESHQIIIARELTRAFRLQIPSQRLMINVSPGSGKSTLVSMWVAWTMAQYPDSRFLYLSYSKDLSSKHTETIKRIIQLRHYRELFGVEIRHDSRGKEFFQTTTGGIVAAAGSSGTVTGLDAGTPGVDRFSGCFVAKTKVSMADGTKKDIENVVVGDIVLSYNHSSNMIEPKKVLALSIFKRNNLIEVETENGIRTRCTDNHRFFDGRTYTAIFKFSKGDFIFTEKIQSLDEMLSLSDSFSTKIERSKKIASSWTNQNILFKKLQSRVRSVLSSAYKIRNDKLSSLRKANTSTFSFNNYMFKKMLRNFAFSKDERLSKLKLPWSSQRLSNTFSTHESSYKKTRWWMLFDVYIKKKITCASHRPRQAQQSTMQFNNSMPKLSYNSSQIFRDTISTIKRISTEETEVYDIQVEKNHNFFANGILVHNSLIIDDPIKPSEAHSDTIREGVIENYRETIQQRVRSEKVPIIFIGQRVHESDLCDYLLKGNDGYEWERVILKSIDDAGNAMYPEVNSKEMLLNKQKFDPYVYAAQYDQNPVPAGGGLFKPEWFVILDKEPNLIATFITADTAETDKSWNDATVFSFWGVYEIETMGRKTGELGLHWLDCVETRIEPKDLKEAFIDFYANCSLHPKPPLMAAIEKKSTGVTLVSTLREMRGMQIREIERNKSSGSKTQRLLEMQPYIASRRISFTEHAKHIDMCIKHMSKLTANNSHRWDDIGDTAADAIRIALIEKTIYSVNTHQESRKQIIEGMNKSLQQKIKLGAVRYGGTR
jgi:predicted phage terminase large subunit-like protein